MKKVLSVLALAAVGFAAQQAYAVVTSQGFVEGHVTSVSVSDRSVENGMADSDLAITFDVAGTECGAARAAGATFNIHRSDQATGVYDNFVKTAQAAYLSGKTLRYSTAKSSPTSSCFAYYMQLK
jgi:hypothetical protein